MEMQAKAEAPYPLFFQHPKPALSYGGMARIPDGNDAKGSLTQVRDMIFNTG